MIRTPEHLRELLLKLDDLAAVTGVGFRWNWKRSSGNCRS